MNSVGLDVPKGFGSMQLQPLRARSSVSPAWELWRLLDELDSLLTEVDSDVYCARFVAEVSGSIGEHVRHCLDHVSALLAADSSTTLSYDRRQRGTTVETDPAEAVRQILRLKRGIEAWSTRPLDETIRVTSMISPSVKAGISAGSLRPASASQAKPCFRERRACRPSRLNARNRS